MSKKKSRRNQPDKNKNLPVSVQKIITDISQTSQNPINSKCYKRPPNSEIIEALVKCRNNKTKAGKLLSVDRKTIKEWLDTDPDLAKELKEVQEEILEWVIDKEFELIEGVWFDDERYRDKKTGEPFVYKQVPCWRSVQHYLDSQGKHLGFGADKTSIKINNSQNQTNSNQITKQRVILEVPRNGRNTAEPKPTTETTAT